jgi:hypothetical protein
MMTTHQSPLHVDFLEKCWGHAVRRVPLLQAADLLYYTSAKDPVQVIYNLGFRNVKVLQFEEDVQVQNQSYTWRQMDRRKQIGAIRAMVDPSLREWLHPYDWVIRLNPDVLIREDLFFRTHMMNDSIAGIFHRVGSSEQPLQLLHSDFYMFRPRAFFQNQNIPRCRQRRPHAEAKLLCLFQSLIEDGRALVEIPNVRNRGKLARIAGKKSPVIHDHELVRACPNYFRKNWK